MKRIFTLLMICSVMAIALVGCGSSGAKSQAAEQEKAPSAAANTSTAKATANNAKSLIVYYSWGGNTKQVAEEIQKQTGADVFEIIPEKPYTSDYDAVVQLAKEEKANNARPAITGKIDNLENYDVVFVGFPNWWSDMPMVLYTFFDAHDLSGKKIVPFCTSGGGGFADSINSMRSLEPNAEILDGLHIRGSRSSQSAVTDLLKQIGMAK